MDAYERLTNTIDGWLQLEYFNTLIVGIVMIAEQSAISETKSESK